MGSSRYIRYSRQPCTCKCSRRTCVVPTPDGVSLRTCARLPTLPPAGSSSGSSTLVLKERELLGEGAFSRVSEVVEDNSQRTFALKRMTKTAALQCPEHVYCEQHISKNTTNAFCIRQYASFKVRVFGCRCGVLF